MNLFPIVSFASIPLAEANVLLAEWGHRMGPINRPQFKPDSCHALYHEDAPVALTVMSQLITATMGQALPYLTRDNTCELSRLCAIRPGLCRVALRIWREFVFAESCYKFAVSYQDADLHSGNTYRFDGWECVGASRSGTDMRSGLKGRNKKIWQWPPTKTDVCRETVEAGRRMLAEQAAATLDAHGMKRFYIAFDGRAAQGDTDHAACLEMLGYFADREDALFTAIGSLGGDMEFCLYSYAEPVLGKLMDERNEIYHPAQQSSELAELVGEE